MLSSRLSRTTLRRPQKPIDLQLKAEAITACDLCDPDGYVCGSNRVCDHIDHSETNARGMRLVRESLRKEASGE